MNNLYRQGVAAAGLATYFGGRPTNSQSLSGNGGTDYYERNREQEDKIKHISPQSLNDARTSAYTSPQVQSIPLSTQSRILIEMLLSPDLEGRIVDKSLNTVANVIFSKSRS